MALIRQRPRLTLLLGLFLYMLVGFTVSDIQSLESRPADPESCPAPLLRRGPDGGGHAGGPRTGGSGLTILQGNAWMLPSRPLLLPYVFSVDRRERLEKLVEIILACRPDVVVLQEVFEVSMVRLLARTLPAYRVLASGRTDLTGTLNASGLVTLTRLPVRGVHFQEFEPLPVTAKAMERLGRKGLLAVDVDSPGFRGTILNLHLYAARDAAEEAFAQQQLAEVVGFARERAAAGWTPLLAGDFNLEPRRAIPHLPEGWAVSDHGPTYDPKRNAYTVRGSNNTPGNHDDRRMGLGVKTVDWLAHPAEHGFVTVSEVLEGPALSDHFFVQHVVLPTGR